MKRKVGSTLVVDHRQVEPVALGDGRPVGDARAAQRVHAEAQPAGADRLQVDDGGQVVDVGGDVVVRARRRRRPARTARARTPVEARVEQLVGLALDPRRDLGVGRAAVGRVVLEAAVLGRVVRRRDHDPVGGARRPPPRLWVRIACEITGRRRVAVVGVDHHVHAVGGQHLEDRAEGRLGQRVGVAAEEQRAVDALRRAVVADGLADRQDVRLVERARRSRAAVARGAERDALLGAPSGSGCSS